MGNPYQAMDAGKIVIISAPHCPGCKQQKRIIERMGIEDQVETYMNLEVDEFCFQNNIMHAPTILWRMEGGTYGQLKGPVQAKTLESLVLNTIEPA